MQTKLIENTPEPHDAKENYQSFLRKKNAKMVEQWKIITQQPKATESRNVVDMSVVTL